MCLYLKIGSLQVYQVRVRSYWIRVAPNQTINILMRRGHGDSREGDHVKMEAEIAVVQLQAKEQS